MNKIAKNILDFWFVQSTQKEKFSRNEEFDNKIRTNFFDDYGKVIIDEYDNWNNTPEECLALIILLDQFSRNLFRNNPKAFAMDKKCRKVARYAIEKKYHKKLPIDQILFIFLPFMHSEELDDQIYCNELIDSYLINHPGYEEIKKFSKLHHDIINEFGRFPYRNKVLERNNTVQEDEYLNSTHHEFFNI